MARLRRPRGLAAQVARALRERIESRERLADSARCCAGGDIAARCPYQSCASKFHAASTPMTLLAKFAIVGNFVPRHCAICAGGQRCQNASSSSFSFCCLARRHRVDGGRCHRLGCGFKFHHEILFTVRSPARDFEDDSSSEPEPMMFHSVQRGVCEMDRGYGEAWPQRINLRIARQEIKKRSGAITRCGWSSTQPRSGWD